MGGMGGMRGMAVVGASHNLNKIASQRKTHAPPRRCLYLRETKSWRWEEGGEEGEEVSLLTHATARGVGKNSFTPHSALEWGS